MITHSGVGMNKLLLSRPHANSQLLSMSHIYYMRIRRLPFVWKMLQTHSTLERTLENHMERRLRAVGHAHNQFVAASS